MHARLQWATRELHERVEAAFAPQALLGTLESYTALLGELYSFHRSVESALGALDWTGTGIAIGSRRKSAWIEADLRDLGARCPSGLATHYSSLPKLGSRAGGMGCLYVLEGATLGGRIILRQASRPGILSACAS